MKRLAVFFALLLSLCVWSTAQAAPSLRSVSVSPDPVAGGGVVTVTVNLSSTATRDTRVSLDSSSSYLDLPSSVVVQEGKRSGNVKVTTGRTSSERRVTVTATYDDVRKTDTLTIDPLALSSVSVRPTTVTGDSSVVGTVKLNGSAETGGYVVSLSDDSASVDVPSTVTVPAGKTSTTFTIRSGDVSSTTKAVITASAGGISKSSTVTVTPLAITKVSGSTAITGGKGTTGKVTFNGTTPAGGASVSLASSNPSLITVPATVTAKAGVSTVSFPVTTLNTRTQQSVTITATFNGVSKTYVITLKPVALSSLSADPKTVVGSQQGSIKVSLTGPAPEGGIVATLTSADAALTAPTSITIPEGASFGTVRISTELVTTSTPVLVSAELDGASRSTTVNVAPMGVLNMVAVTGPTGGNKTTVEVGINAPAPPDGMVVELSSSNPSLISLPETITFDEGQRDVEVEYLPAVVSEDTVVVLTATYASSTKSISVTIKPARFINIGLNAGVTTGGNQVEATVTLTGPAPEEGYIVDLTATLTAASVSNPTPGATGNEPVDLPVSVLVPAGDRMARFSIATAAVPSKTVVYIRGSGGTWKATTRLTVEAPQLRDFNPRPVGVTQTGSTPIVIRLTGEAPAGGVIVALTSSNASVVTVPATATVPAGATSVTAYVTGKSTAAVGSSAKIKVTALGKSVDGQAFITNLRLTGLSLSTDAVIGGNSVTGRVTLSGPAPAGGAAVGLDVVDDALTVPASVLVPAGSTTATFTVATGLVPSPRGVVVYARFGGTSQSADLFLDSLGPVSLTLDGTDVEGGESVTATITLNGTTPPYGGQIVEASVFASPEMVTVPGTVAFGRSDTTVTFTVTGVAVAVDTPITLVVEVNGQTVTNADLTVHPPSVESLTVSSSALTGGTANTGTVTLSSPAPQSGWTVVLSSDNPSAVPATAVTIAPGATTGSFQIGTQAVASDTVATITARRGLTSATASFTIKPPRLVSLAVSDADLEGGFANTSVTVTLNGPAPAGGWTVALSSSNPAAANLSAGVTVAAGSTTATATAVSYLVAADTAVTISGTKGSDTATKAITVRQIKVTAVSLSATSVQGGGSVTATVTINRPVPTTGVTVSLSSASSAATVPATALVPVGQTTVSVTVSTVAVATNTTARITGSFNGGSAYADLTVLAPVVTAVSANPTTLIGGWATSTGTVTISHPAPVGGFPVSLTASNGGASVAESVTVGAGATYANFTISTAVVSADRSVTITATRNGVSATTAIVVQPLVVSGLSISPTTMIGGDQNATATLTLNGNAPAGGAEVAVTSSNTSSATVPATVTVPAGSSTATFTVSTIKRSSSHPVTVTTTYNGVSRTASIQVNGPSPSGLSIAQSSVIGGQSATGTVTLNSAAPTGGLAVSLSSNSSSATVPATVTVAAGSTTATFTVSTVAQGSNQTATITATANGASATDTLTVVGLTLTNLTVNASTVQGGVSLTATATISSPAPAGGVTVTMSSNRSQAIPVNIVIAQGQTSGSATVTTQGVTANTSVTLTGTLNGTTRTATFTINRVQVVSIATSSTWVKGGNAFNVTVYLNGAAPVGGLTLVAGDNSDLVAMPSSVTVPAGASSVTISVGTSNVNSNQTKYVGVEYDGVQYIDDITLVD